MTSKKFIKHIRKTFIVYDKEIEEHFDKLEKELEVLEILKKHSDIHLSSVQDNQLVIATSGLNCAYIDLSQKELKLIKEWLNDN